MDISTSTKPESLASRGRRENSRSTFKVLFDGQQIYDLLELLESRAVQDDSYLRVRQCVSFAETIREQARAQGF
jgi:hypothetical protein